MNDLTHDASNALPRRRFLGGLAAAGSAFSLPATLFGQEASSAAQPAEPLKGHFHPKGKAPSKFTIDILKKAGKTLPFDDTRDFEEFKKGLIAPMKEMKIMADAGNVAWDMERFQFVHQQEEFDSIHPSLLRQARLNNNYGVYEVIPGIYQVRGFDLSNITFVRGKTGWIAFDPMISAETVRAAWNLFQKHVGEGLPVTAVIYSHTHGDHWGGVRGLIKEEDVRAGKVAVIAPDGFMDHTISENVYAGNAMNRRLFYQYALLLPASAHGMVDMALGKGVSAGTSGLIAPTRLVADAIEEFEVDGLKMVFQNTPNTEAPREMNTYIPEWKALWMAENVCATQHNIYTLRGAPVRDALNWSKYIAQALYRFGMEAEVMFASHHWPRWGNARIQEVLRAQRDLYANLNNQVLHLANQGVTINQVHNVYQPPTSLQKEWHCRGYHGSFENNSRGVIQRFLGYWDGNPVNLLPAPESETGAVFVEMMGGAEKIIAKGQELYNQGQYKVAQEIVNKLVQTDPRNQTAKDLLADIFEQIGYQQENAGLRNSFLAAAYELRTGIPQGAIASSSSPDVVRAMSTELFLNFLGIRMDSKKAEGMRFTINLITPDNGEKFVIELENATLTNIQGFQAEKPDLTLTINRSDLELSMMGVKPIEQQIKDGTAKFEGDITILAKLAATMVEFDPRFEIMPGTKAVSAGETEADAAFEAPVGAAIAE
jgi:alkyl sulfatase BDS1-like metallo-beta-lactamase superfamily hydrolase